MIRFIIGINLILIGLSPLTGQSIEVDDLDEWKKREEVIKEWLDNLYEMGVEVDGDSLIIRKEVLQLFQDSNYYHQAFPETYTWDLIIASLQAMHFKLAFWYLINIYHNDRAEHGELVVKTIVAFKDVIQPVRLLMSSFYTFAYFSPESGKIINGKLEVIRPDLLDQKFTSFKQLVDEVTFFISQ